MTAPTIQDILAQATVIGNQPGAADDAGDKYIQQQLSLYGNAITDSSTGQSAATPVTATATAANVSPALAPSGLPLLTDIISGKVTPPGYQPQIGSGPAITNAAGSWVSAHIGNYGLVILGGLLVVGALLISQKDNISKAAVTVAKVAAV
jgi:hypothetical protein